MTRSIAAALGALLLAVPPAIGQARVTTSARPEVFQDIFPGEAALVPERTEVYLDGIDVTSQATVGPRRISFRPAEDLPVGTHTVRFVIVDEAGNRAETSWSFDVDPSAADLEAPRLRFVDPTPANGAQLASGIGLAARVAVDDGQGSGYRPGSGRILLYWKGRPFKDLTPDLREVADGFEVRLPPLTAGSWGLMAHADDRDGNRSRQQFVAFRIGQGARHLTAIEWSPTSPIAGDDPVAVRFRVRFDPSYLPDRVTLVLLRGGVEAARIEAEARFGQASLPWNGLVDGRPAPPGVYSLRYHLVSVHGRRDEGLWPEVLRIGSPAPAPEPPAAAPEVAPPPVEARPEFDEPLDLLLDRARRDRTSEPRIEITGSTRPGARVEIRVNGLRQEFVYARRSGDFRFPAVALEEGRNRISVVAEDLESGQRSREVRLDRTIVFRPALAGGPSTGPGGTSRPGPGGGSEPPPPPIDRPVIRTPHNGQSIPAGRPIRIEGQARGADKVEILVDGRLHSVVLVRGVAFGIHVDLEAGHHRIEARAIASDGRRSELSEAVRFEVVEKGLKNEPRGKDGG